MKPLNTSFGRASQWVPPVCMVTPVMTGRHAGAVLGARPLVFIRAPPCDNHRGERPALGEVAVYLVDDQSKGWFREPSELVRWSCEETVPSDLVVGPNLSQDPTSEFSDKENEVQRGFRIHPETGDSDQEGFGEAHANEKHEGPGPPSLGLGSSHFQAG